MSAVIAYAALAAHLHVELKEFHLYLIRREPELSGLIRGKSLCRVIHPDMAVDRLVKVVHLERCGVLVTAESFGNEVSKLCV